MEYPVTLNVCPLSSAYIDCTMGVFNKILPIRQNLIFWYVPLLVFYCVVKTWNLRRNSKITLKNGFRCLTHVCKVRAKPRFCSLFMYLSILLSDWGIKIPITHLKYIRRKKILPPIYLIIKHSHLSGLKCFSRCLNMKFVLV